MTNAERIRAAVVGKLVLSDPDAHEAWFTVGEVKTWVPWAQQPAILAAVTAMKPLAEFGIAWTQQSGFNANQGQEIKWTWDAEKVRRQLSTLKWRFPQLHDLVQQHARSV